MLNEAAEHRLRIENIELPKLSDGEALVRIKAAALNHRDEWIREGKYAKIKYPSVLGSDGCGVVEEITGADQSLWGQEVIMNPNINWGSSELAQSADYEVYGMPAWGTFAEYTVVPAHRLHPRPAHLTAVQAAALPLAGMTAWRAAMAQGEVAPGQNVLITGIGGGVAQFAFEFSQTVGAQVYVTSGSADKLQRAVEMGAAGEANYTMENWHKQLNMVSGGFDVIIDGAAGDQMNVLLDLLRPGGRLISYGATLGRPEFLNVYKIYWKQLRLQGTTMGSDKDFSDMLEFINEHKMLPIVDSVYPFEAIGDAFARMQQGEQFGKIVVSMDGTEQH